MEVRKLSSQAVHGLYVPRCRGTMSWHDVMARCESWLDVVARCESCMGRGTICCGTMSSCHGTMSWREAIVCADSCTSHLRPPPGFACPMNMENIAATSPGARHCATRCQTEMHSFWPRSVLSLNLHKVWPETLRLLTAAASVPIAPFDRPPRVLAHLPMARRHTDLCLSLDLPCRNDLCENLHLPMHPA